MSDEQKNGSAVEDQGKPITLIARQDVNTGIDFQNRIVVFPCRHPDGLLGHYQLVVPFHHLKRMAGVIQRQEGINEREQLQKMAAQRSGIVKPA